MCCRGLLGSLTRLRQKQTHESKENPPRTPNQTNKNSTEQRQQEEKDTKRRFATIKERQTSKTEHQQDAGPREDRKANHSSPNSRIKNQGLACEHQQRKRKNKQTNKQTTRANNTRKLSKHKNTHKTTQRKTKARPRREKGDRVDQPKVGKRFQPPPSGRLAILPIREGVGRDGPSARRGEEESRSTTWGQENQTRKKGERENKKGPRAHCKSPRAKISNGSWPRSRNAMGRGAPNRVEKGEARS